MTEDREPAPHFTVHGTPWAWRDLANAASWASQVDWTAEKYANPNDHAHCGVCWWDLRPSSDPEVGEAFRHHGHWLCAECHRQFVVPGKRCIDCARVLGGVEAIRLPAFETEGTDRWLCVDCSARARGA